ncbi:MAG: primosomal protein N' [Planctomycetes bacterium]|nr:primosomal protein N' [Planctomycetota bacterium]
MKRKLETPGLFPVEPEPAPSAPKRGGRKPRAQEEPAPLEHGFYVDVAVQRPLRCEFTYAVPARLRAEIALGVRVAVPFGPRREIGVVTRVREETDVPTDKLKSVAAVLDPDARIGPDLFELTRWMSSYYACSWGEALGAVMPAALKKEGGGRRVAMIAEARAATAEELEDLEKRSAAAFRLLRALHDIGAPAEARDLCRKLNVSDSSVHTLVRRGLATRTQVLAHADPLDSAPVPSARVRPEALSADQTTALDALGKALEGGEFTTFLLQGVTGSGKTEVYLRAIEAALARGKGAIVIVPEIALTPQTVGWFRSRFGSVAVLHSRMTDVQRRSMWLAVQRGEARVVVGARSAVFAPVKDLGVVVVDEEHEPSFKQESSPRYHARDVAVMRARLSKAVCILGSATPALETWHNAKQGRYRHLHLRQRVSGGQLPKVEVVDLRAEKREGGQPVLFSHRLRQLLAEGLERGEQSILFLNRRGFAPTLWCAACGETLRCKHCDVGLTFHRKIGRVVCHSCCEEQVPPKHCPTCTAPLVHYLGAGSERVELALKKLLPAARVRRMDSDTMLRREDYEEALDAFGRGEIDVLVGTQMIAKGLDFPRVTVVGIVSADSSLHLPDFRAAERTFQLLAQVAGRAGRGALPGRIVIQTVTPEHPAIVCAAKHDFEGFAGPESRLRAELGYPPHGRLIRVVFEDDDLGRVHDVAAACAKLLREKASGGGLVLLGPAEAPISQVRGRHRQHLLVKAPAASPAIATARTLLLEFAGAETKTRVTIDIDPVSML